MTMPCNHKNRLKGLTLIEVMVVVVILGILAAIAYPSYLDQVRKSKRAVAKNALLDLANRQEKYYFSARSYAGIAQIYNLPTTTAVFLDSKGGLSTTSSASAVYKLSVVNASTSAFDLKAEPQNDQVNDACGTFTLSSSNVRGATASDCW